MQVRPLCVGSLGLQLNPLRANQLLHFRMRRVFAECTQVYPQADLTLEKTAAKVGAWAQKAVDSVAKKTQSEKEKREAVAEEAYQAGAPWCPCRQKTVPAATLMPRETGLGRACRRMSRGATSLEPWRVTTSSPCCLPFRCGLAKVASKPLQLRQPSRARDCAVGCLANAS